jgi:hypothetical protein
VPATRREERIERVTAEIRIHRHRIGEGRLAVRRLEIRGRVRARSRADVTPLRIGDHLQPRRPRVGANVLEGTGAVSAERLEECDLRLDRYDIRRNRVNETPAETRARIRRLGAAEMGLALQLDGQEVRPRVEPDDQLRALPLDGLGQAVGEVRRRNGGHTVRVLRPKDGEGRVNNAAFVSS